VGWSCPWAHRTLIVRALKGLSATIPVTVVNGDANAGGWVLPRAEGDCRTLADIYRLAAPTYSGRATVPVLWDEVTRSIVNNESADIIEILDREFNNYATNPDCQLAPVDLQPQITAWNDRIYPAINNGVYQCGFARSQRAFDRAHSALFELLTELDLYLADNPYLCGDRLTLADVRLFPTLIRFDLVYYHLFKCNHRRIQDYPHLLRYTRQIYHLAGIKETCNLPVTLRDYYHNLFPLNPSGIVPPLPDMKFYL
jgi:putative glutathione S-transferase